MRIYLLRIIFAFSVIFCPLFLSLPAQAQDQRQLCKKFWPNVSTQKCISIQEAGRKRLTSGTYYDSVVETCKSQSKILDRKAVYINYYEADKCAVKEQARVLAEEESKAYIKKNNAEAEYYRKAAKSGRKYPIKHTD